jgi:hypothetical protein
MTKTALVLAFTAILSAAAGSALTWLVAYPRAVAEARAALASDEQAQVAKAVQSQLADVTAKAVSQIRAEDQARDQDAVARVASALTSGLQPIRTGMTVQQQRPLLLRNAAIIEGIDTSECPPSFQETYRQASMAFTAYAVEFSHAPISGKMLVTDAVELWTTGGIALPVLLEQGTAVHGELAAQAAARERAKAALGRLQQAAARYGVRL